MDNQQLETLQQWANELPNDGSAPTDALRSALKDAERYLWLKENSQWGMTDIDAPQLIHRDGMTDGGEVKKDWRNRLDNAIDALMTPNVKLRGRAL